MSYKLPEEIKYHEKIVFGLTWKQVVKISIYSTASFFLLKNPFFPRKYSIGMAAGLMMMGTGLTISGLDENLYKYLSYAASFDEAGYLDQNAFKFTGIKDIRNRKIVKNNGKQLAIIRVSPLNLRVKSGRERERILENYKDFLNSLDFPITIHVRNVDSLNSVKNYFKQLEERVEENVEENGNPELKHVYREQKKFFTEYMKQNGSKKRLYYIIVPVKSFDSDTDASKKLDHRVELIQEKLMPVGLETCRLDTRELVSFSASYFEEFVEKNRDYLFPLTIHREQKTKSDSKNSQER